VSVRIVFESHGRSTDNEAGVASGWRDPSLSEAGRKEAAELADRYANVDVVYTSDLKRAVETAEIAFGPGFKIDKRLRESDYGSMTGMSSDVIRRERKQRLDVAFPDGESMSDVVERVRDFLNDVAREHDGQTVLVIGHYATHVALDHLLGGKTLEDAVEPYEWLPELTYELSA
jgi:alpha-ribazole phosphatase/probable phosphoglycerate mutase